MWSHGIENKFYERGAKPKFTAPCQVWKFYSTIKLSVQNWLGKKVANLFVQTLKAWHCLFGESNNRHSFDSQPGGQETRTQTHT